MKHKILVFDFDGTIADTLNYTVQISNRLAKRFKFREIAPEDMERLQNSSFQDAIKFLKVPRFKIPFILARAKKELHKDINLVEPIAGLVDVLAQLQTKNLTMGIITTNSKKNVNFFLENHSISCFDFVVSTSRVMGKHRSIKRLLRRKGFNVEDVVYIGDETRDIEAAKEAGIRIASVTWGFNSQAILERLKPDFLIEQPSDLLKLVD